MKIKKVVGMILAVVLTVSMVQFAQPRYSTVDAASKLDSKLKNTVVLFKDSPVAYVNNIKTHLDPSNQEECPIIKDNKMLAPVRFIGDSLGAKVEWDSNTSTAVISLKGKEVKLLPGKNKMILSNTNRASDVPVEIVNGKTFVSVRPFAQALGKKVFYHNGLVIISDKYNVINPNTEKILLDELISRVNVLPTVGTYDNLKNLLAKFNSYNRYTYNDIMIGQPLSENQAMKAADSAAPSVASDYSSTNVQVQGVDEADIVKNDGKYIYQVNNQKIVVIKAYPVEEMEVASTVEFKDKNFSPQELYLDDKYLVAIGTTYSNDPVIMPSLKKVIGLRPPYYNSKSTVKAIVYDITDKSNLKQIREVEAEGSYISSRKIGSSVYLVSNKNINYYYIQNEGGNITPCYRDSNLKDSYIDIDYSQIKYFPEIIRPNYLIVAGFNLESNEPANVSTYLGASENIYASLENLYIAATNYMQEEISVDKTTVTNPVYYNNTLVYKFSLKDGNVTYKGKGTVPGTILNQFSMDESNGYFRIATTKGDVWREDEYASKNNIYVLDNELNIVGRLEDVAPGERIYSVRFMGDRAYMVTFKKVDPLFVIDLKDATNPKILGALKIPGYSDYLHPYDENHIIGFGKDAIPAKEGNFAWYQGMKMALFDVSDVSNPIEMYSEIMGDRGTESDLLHNHKALLFSKDKNLLAFPITVMEIKGKDKVNAYGYPEYGTFSFQGAYIYNMDLANGFKLKGKITHLTDDEYSKAGDYWYDSNKNVERIIYIDKVLYTLSKGKIKANDMNTLEELKFVEIKQ